MQKWLEVVSKLFSAAADDLGAAAASTFEKKSLGVAKQRPPRFFTRLPRRTAYLVILATSLFLRPLLLLFFGVACAMFVPSKYGYAQIPGTESVRELYHLDNKFVAAYDASKNSMRILVDNQGVLQEKVEVPTDSTVMAAVALPENSVAYAKGMIRGDATRPIQVHRYNLDSGSDTLLFEYSGERNQVVGLRWNQSKLWIDFFESKYFTTIGYLSPTADKLSKWEFTKVGQLRMGDSFDVLGDTLVVGRSYGDEQGEDGDVLLFQKGSKELLPSYRGVRAVKLFGDSQNPSIVIADGWHANYGQVAQARVSLLRKRVGEDRYALELIDRDHSNYSFGSLFTFRLHGKNRIAALGNASLIVYTETPGKWSKEVIYTKVQPDTLLAGVLVRSDESGAMFAVADGGVRVVSYKG